MKRGIDSIKKHKLTKLGRRRSNISLSGKLYLLLLFIISLSILYFVLPEDARFGYEFSKGKPWQHESLYAPYDFPIVKSRLEVEAEIDSLMSSHTPYFDLNRSISDSIAHKLSGDMTLMLSGKDVDSIEFVLVSSRLKASVIDLYSSGVISGSTKLSEELNRSERAVIVKDRYLNSVLSSTIHTLKGATEIISEEWKSISSKTSSEVRFFIQNADISEYVVPNLIYNEEASNQSVGDIVSTVSNTKGVVQEGERIISKGDVITGEKYRILESLRQSVEEGAVSGNDIYYVYGGKILLLILILSMIFFYGFRVYLDVLTSKRSINLLLSLLIIFALLSKVVSEIDILNVYMVPVVILAILVHTFIDKRIAIFSNTVLAIIIGLFAPNPFEYVLMQFIAGTVSVISLSKIQKRRQSVITAVYVFIAYSLTFIAFSVTKEGGIDGINWNMLIWFGINSFLLTMVQPLGWICEKFFGFVSDMTYIELSDTNHPLLRKLAEESPGTFQHSIQVANLAEQTVSEIGGNSLKARVGAMFHDIGKSENPLYFTENQQGITNPHNEMLPEASASVIIKHVTDGVKLAKRYNLPSSIVEFITSHHGESLTGYFYGMKVREVGKDNVDAEKFRYPGPCPISLECAVVMLVDGIEAASRSLPVKDQKSLSDIIDQIVDGKIRSGELKRAKITFEELERARAIILKKLMNIYHVRIAYPEEAK